MSGDSQNDSVTVDALSVSDGAYTLFVADFDDTAAAWEAYEFLKGVEDGRHLEIESVIVVKRGDDGKIEVQKATDHSTERARRRTAGRHCSWAFRPRRTRVGSGRRRDPQGAGQGEPRRRVCCRQGCRG